MAAKRRKLKSEEKARTFSSGCTLLDCALGGGYALNRVVNVVGDNSTGKTLLAIEAAANFIQQFKDGEVKYRETEYAFDEDFAQSLGLPIKQVDLSVRPETVEDLFEDLEKIVAEAKTPTLYVIDSLDAISDKAEQERDIREGTYGAGKQKKLSELFRRLAGPLSKSNVTVLVISQIRFNMKAKAFGKQHTRSGGKALDFYASQIVWLNHIGRVHRTKKKVKRAVGVNITAKVEKNKIGPPFREATFPIIFNYGVEDVVAGLLWLHSCGQTDKVGMTLEVAKKTSQELAKLDADEYRAMRLRVSEAVQAAWREVEEGFATQRSKY